MNRFVFILCLMMSGIGQDAKLTIDRIYQTRDFTVSYGGGFQWFEGGTYFTVSEDGNINRYDTRTLNKTNLVSRQALTPKGQSKPLPIYSYSFTDDQKQVLIFTNTRRVWRYHTRGDYWVLNRNQNKLQQLGKDRPEATLMFTKLSPDQKSAAYVSESNIYLEDLASGNVRALTSNGNGDIINGTFDWAYEEEFGCRDGFAWSPDGKYIAFWQVDATNIRDFYMINTTDSVYSRIIPVQYPKVGEDPSPAKIGVIDVASGNIVWLRIPGDAIKHYLPRMKWSTDSKSVFVQQLNRKQNHMKLFQCQLNGSAKLVYEETDDAWIDAVDDWLWLDDNRLLWTSERSGWRHIYSVSKIGELKKITDGSFDVINILRVDKERNEIDYIASPTNPTQRYLYRVNYRTSQTRRLTPNQAGTHDYNISQNGKFARHVYSSLNNPPTVDLVELPSHRTIRVLADNATMKKNWEALDRSKGEFFRVDIGNGVELDGYMLKPGKFDAKKKYPLIVFVYSEPAGQTARDAWPGGNMLYHTMLTQQGYIVVTMDNRGTPSPRGRNWRKSIYRRIGDLNIHDQAKGLKALQKKFDFIDADRIGVWGWSGGGTATLNLLFMYPDLYHTGVSIAPVTWQYNYDNIYQERYMGLKSENPMDFENNSPVKRASGLKGNLLLIHGTGDDNVHYQSSEMLINELIKHQKYFQFMPYPNRSHGIYEGQNTRRHLYMMMEIFFQRHLPAGARTQ